MGIIQDRCDPFDVQKNEYIGTLGNLDVTSTDNVFNLTVDCTNINTKHKWIYVRETDVK